MNGVLKNGVPQPSCSCSHTKREFWSRRDFLFQSGGGIAIFVGQARQPTKAMYRLDSPQEVLETLQLIGQQ